MEYTTKNIGKLCPQYGGVLTDINKLPIGTSFYVKNGAWSGRIVEINGEKYVQTDINVVRLNENAEYINALVNIQKPNEQVYDIIITAVTDDGHKIKITTEHAVSDTLSNADADKAISLHVDNVVAKHLPFAQTHTFVKNRKD